MPRYHGTQGVFLGPTHPPAQIPLFSEPLETIYARVFCELQPGAAVPTVSIQFRPFAGAKSSIRMMSGSINVKLSDLLEEAPGEVLESLARILMGKLFRRPAATEHRKRYRMFLNEPEIRQKLHQLRSLRGRKYVSGPHGLYFNLAEIFDRLNLSYFNGNLETPSLGWSLLRSRTLLGHFDPSHNAIVVSKIFDEPSVPLIAVEYVLFHEMLHLQFPVDYSGSRRKVHTREFRQAEKEFPRLAEARAALKKLT